MLKFYLDTVIIYFLIYVTSGLLLKKEFVKARDKFRKELEINDKLYSNIKTTLGYLLLSFIPFIRLIALITKFYMITNTEELIKKVKGNENVNSNK